MKILITEKQLMELTRYSFEQDLDDVLGKLSDQGIDSLTPEEKEFLKRVSNKLQGQNINVGEPNPSTEPPGQPNKRSSMVPNIDNDSDEYDDDTDLMDDPEDYYEDESSDLHNMFMDLYPEDYNFSFGNKNWYVEKWGDVSEKLILKVSSNDFSYYIDVFEEENKISVVGERGVGFDGTIEEHKMPKDEETMYKFIDTFNKMLPMITKRILSQK